MPKRQLFLETRTIALVEDNAADAYLLREMLATASGAQFKVDHTQTLASGLKGLESSNPDVVLLDLSLPDSSGIETFRRFRKKSSLPVVVITGSADESLALSAVREGAQDYLVKSQLTPELLVRSVRYAVERSRSELRLRLSRRLETVGRLAGGIAHDFNNLLTAMLGSVELLRMSSGLDAEQTVRVDEIGAACHRAADLTRQLLAFSRQQTLSIGPVDLDQTLGGLEPLLRRTLGDDIRLAVQRDEALPKIEFEATQLEQIILHLALNARDAMTDGGSLNVETRLVDFKPDDPWLRDHQPQPDGSYVRLRIADDGPGMDHETLDHIFDPFFTTKSTISGLGLATVYGIVKQCGGYIWAESAPGAGATVDIYFRIAEEQSPTPKSQPVSTGKRPPTWDRRSRRNSVLLVENDQSVRDVTARFLIGAGQRVETAENGIEALELLHRRDFDLVITDVVMPEMSGPEMVTRAERTNPRLKVLFVSGYSANEHMQPQLGGRRHRFLPKPYSRQQLVELVTDLLGEE